VTVAPKAATVDAYIAACPAAVQAILAEIRRRILLGAPAATEKISYGIPAFTVRPKARIYVGAWREHIGIYPVPAGDEALERDLAPFRAAKGTLRFPLSEPFPYDLLDRLVAAAAAPR
jgi:uncharacterized protein YdhG (YjbR/CyaY superfamily)